MRDSQLLLCSVSHSRPSKGRADRALNPPVDALDQVAASLSISKGKQGKRRDVIHAHLPVPQPPARPSRRSPTSKSSPPALLVARLKRPLRVSVSLPSTPRAVRDRPSSSNSKERCTRLVTTEKSASEAAVESSGGVRS